MKTNYIGHDDLYKQRKAKGWSGWADEQTVESNLRTLQTEFDRSFVPISGRALELGCGAGELTWWLAEKGFTTTGIDIAPTAIKWAKQKKTSQNTTAEFVIGDVCTLEPFADGTFDLVVDGHCLHCIVGEDRKLVLQHAYRVLQTGGLLFVKTMCGDLSDSRAGISDRLRSLYDAKTRCLINDGFATRYIGLPQDIMNEVSAAGFSMVHWRINSSDDAIDSMDELLIWAMKRPTASRLEDDYGSPR